MTVDIGLRLSRYFGMSEDYWISLQLEYDASNAKESLSKLLADIRPWKPDLPAT